MPVACTTEVFKPLHANAQSDDLSMADLVHELIEHSAHRLPMAEALCYQGQRWTYADLDDYTKLAAQLYLSADLQRSERVAVYLEKRLEVVPALFGASAAGATFVPINPLLKPDQVAHILGDCNVKILVTSAERLSTLAQVLVQCPDLHTIFLVGASESTLNVAQVKIASWDIGLENAKAQQQTEKTPPAKSQSQKLPNQPLLPHRCIDSDMAAILYTSGSTGKPKGVVLSHRNLLVGASSVTSYLENHPQDRILAALPLSFDYGLSQLTTGFAVGATVVLMNYLFPRDIINMIEEEKITGLAGVPPLWIQLSQQKWPAKTSLRYLTNSGGAMPKMTLNALRTHLPDIKIYLMYGLTEAFRSTYLPPSEVDHRPDSIGRAIPNAEILVINKDGQHCQPEEEGELVHRGPLVSLGYWNDPEKTAERFKPLGKHSSAQLTGLPLPEIAVWSGDTVRRDKEGYLYFIGRQDEMIKVSGYRISPTEVEDIVHVVEGVAEIAVFAVPHPVTGQAIILVASHTEGVDLHPDVLRKECQRRLPSYMVPAHIEIQSSALPRNPNGKIDRKALQLRFADRFQP